MAAAYPEVLSRLSAALREVEANNDTRQQRFVIGSDKQNPTQFTPEQWSERKVGYWQHGIQSGIPETAPIHTEVEMPGRYHFSLRRWPEEMDESIRAAAELTVPDGLSGETKMERGRSLPIVKARLKVADFDKRLM